MTNYELLGVLPDATREEIKQAYRKRALETHPDLRRGRPAEIKRSNEEFVRISKAYATLIDPQERVQYDDSLNTPTVAAPAKPRNADRGERITPPTLQVPNDAVRVREDLREIDYLRRQIWEEPREVLVLHLILYLVFLTVLPLGIYALIQETASGELGPREILFIPISCGLGLWVAYGVWMRFLRIRASGGPIAVLGKDRRLRRGRHRRPPTVTPAVLLGSVPLLLGLVGISIMLITGFGAAEPSWLPTNVFVLVTSLVVLAVVCWKLVARR